MRRVSVSIVAALLLAACGGTSVFDLTVGDCFDDPSSYDDVSRVRVLDCSEPHDNEVYAVFDYVGSDVFPGRDALEDYVDNECIARFEPYVGIDYFSSEIYFSALWPSAGSWDDGDREIVCFAYEQDLSKIEGSVRGTGR